MPSPAAHTWPAAAAAHRQAPAQLPCSTHNGRLPETSEPAVEPSLPALGRERRRLPPQQQKAPQRRSLYRAHANSPNIRTTMRAARPHTMATAGARQGGEGRGRRLGRRRASGQYRAAAVGGRWSGVELGRRLWLCSHCLGCWRCTQARAGRARAKRISWAPRQPY